MNTCASDKSTLKNTFKEALKKSIIKESHKLTDDIFNYIRNFIPIVALDLLWEPFEKMGKRSKDIDILFYVLRKYLANKKSLKFTLPKTHQNKDQIYSYLEEILFLFDFCMYYNLDLVGLTVNILKVNIWKGSTEKLQGVLSSSTFYLLIELLGYFRVNFGLKVINDSLNCQRPYDKERNIKITRVDTDNHIKIVFCEKIPTLNELYPTELPPIPVASFDSTVLETSANTASSTVSETLSNLTVEETEDSLNKGE